MAHWLHCAQASAFHTGTSTAIPRFSYLVVAVGTQPSGASLETGSLSPF